MPPNPKFDRGSFTSNLLMDKENTVPRVSATALAAKLSGANRVSGTSRDSGKPTLGRDTAPSVLRLGRPTHVPCLKFDDARVESSLTVPLRVQNDTPHTQSAQFDKVPREDGFLIDPDRVVLPPGGSAVVRVTWCPSTQTSTTYNNTLKVSIDDGEGDIGRARRGSKQALEVLLKGSRVQKKAAVSKLKQKAAPGGLSYTFNQTANAARRASVAASTSGNTGFKPQNSMRIAPVGKTLRLRKVDEIDDSNDEPLPMTKPKHASKFASFRTGVSLAGARGTVFGDWINSMIVPAVDFGDGEGARSSKSASRARERRNAENLARERLWSLYSSDCEVREVILRVEAQIDEGRLKLRGAGDGAENDHNALINQKSAGSFMDDVSLREKFRDALSSYSLFWLHAVVDVVVGEGSLEGDVSVKKVKQSEKKERQVLVDALMRDSEINLLYGSEGKGLPPYAEGYSEALAGTVLKRTLLMAFLLDRAQAGVSDKTPLLFRVRQKIKSTSEFVRHALQASCHGEGDVLRRLSHYGYKLHYAQDPIVEFDFGVKNIAVDLRDGIRLCRLVDSLGDLYGDASAVTNATFPANAKVVRRRNVEVALATACSAGVSQLLNVDPEDIVDGNFSVTLFTLYQLQMHFCGPKRLGEWHAVHQETEAWRAKRVQQITDGKIARRFHGQTLASGKEDEDVEKVADEDAIAEALFAEELADAQISSEGASDDNASAIDDTVNVPSTVSRCETALLRWARAVTSTKGVEVANLSTDFANGVALCTLINAYAPELIHAREITRPEFFVGAAFDEAHASVIAANFDVAKRAVTAIGGDHVSVPFDERDVLDANGPDKNVVAGFLLLLRQRLIGRADEQHAARVIQQTWLKQRRTRFEVEEHLPLIWAFERQLKATRLIQKFARGFFGRKEARERAAGIISCQTMRRGAVAQRELQTAINAVTTIAKCTRGMFARYEAGDRRMATEICQTRIRGAFFRNKFLKLKATVQKLQRQRRSSVIRKNFEQYRSEYRAATKIKAAFKGWCVWYDYQEMRGKVVACQRRFRASRKMRVARSRFTELRAAALTSQTIRRATRTRRAFVQTLNATVTVQRHVRGWIARENYLDVMCCVLTCQALRRGAVERQKFTSLRYAAVTTQRFARGAMTRRRAACEATAATMIQSAYRRFVARDLFLEMQLENTASVIIQRHVRGWIAREEYLDVKVAAVTFQAFFRGAEQRRRYLNLREASNTCVRIYREQAAARDARLAHVSRQRVLIEQNAQIKKRLQREEVSKREAAARELAAAREADEAHERTSFAANLRRAAQLEEMEREQKLLEQQERALAIEKGKALKGLFNSRVQAKTPKNLNPNSLCTPTRKSLEARVVKARKLEFDMLNDSLETRAAIVVQTAWRGWNVRMDFVDFAWALVKLQAAHRGAVARRRFTALRNAAVACQRIARDTRQARRAALQSKAATFRMRRVSGKALQAAPARVAAVPAQAEGLEARRFQVNTRTKRVPRAPSNSMLAWSTASSVANSSEDEEDFVEDFEDELDGELEGELEEYANTSQDYSGFDNYHDGTYQTEDPGFVAASDAADALACSKSVGDVRRALFALAQMTRSSASARQAASSPRALRALLRTMRRCDRSDTHEPVLHLAYEVLETLSGDENGCAQSVFEAQDSIVIVTEHMQMCRDRSEVVGAAARTLANLCGDEGRARVVANAERGRVIRRVKGIYEILGNTLAARRHQGHTQLRSLEATVRSMRDLVGQLERCQGEVRYERRVRVEKDFDVKPAVSTELSELSIAAPVAFRSAPARLTSRLGNKRLATVNTAVHTVSVAQKGQPSRRPLEPKQERYDDTRMTKQSAGFIRRGGRDNEKRSSLRQEKENGSHHTEFPNPFASGFGRVGFGARDTFVGSPIMSPRYVR